MTRGVAEALGALPSLASDSQAFAKLARYADVLLARNRALNLTAARDPAAVAEHVRDSLAVAAFVREPLLDVGSGGGFPGIPLAIVTGYHVTLVEAAAKKAAFLREVALELGLAIDVVNARAEDAARDARFRERFASATARAVSNACTVLELTVPFLQVGGLAILQRGRFEAEERAAAADAALVLGARFEAEHGREGDDERRVLLVRKVAATGPRFPRRAGIPAKRPLCVDPPRG